jgi:hypothetical protein
MELSGGEFVSDRDACNFLMPLMISLDSPTGGNYWTLRGAPLEIITLSRVGVNQPGFLQLSSSRRKTSASDNSASGRLLKR